MPSNKRQPTKTTKKKTPPSPRTSGVGERATTSSSSPPLPSASLPKKNLVDVGARVSGPLLLEHYRRLAPKLPHYDFARFGFDAAWTHAMDAQATAIEAARADVQASRDDATPTGSALHDAMGALKEWRRDAATIVAVVPALAGQLPPVTTGSSPDKLVASSRKLFPLVVRAGAAHGGGAAMKADGEARVRAVVAAKETHDAATGKLSPEVRRVNELEGVFYEELRRLARVARRVAPAESSLFAVSTHVHRAGRSRANGAPATPPPTPAKSA